MNPSSYVFKSYYFGNVFFPYCVIRQNFDNPYGTPTHVFRHKVAMSPSYVAHLPKKQLKLLDLPSATDTPGVTQYHGHSNQILSPNIYNTTRNISPAQKKSEAYTFLKIDPADTTYSPINATSLNSNPQSHLIDSCEPRRAKKNKVKRLGDRRQNKGIARNRNQKLLEVTPYMDQNCENQTKSSTSTKRNSGCNKTFLGESLTSVQNRGFKSDTPCIDPVAVPLRAVTNVYRDRALGIAF